MKERGGAIVNIASVSSWMPVDSYAGYSASKAAVAAVTRGAALHCRKSGYRGARQLDPPRRHLDADDGGQPARRAARHQARAPALRRQAQPQGARLPAFGGGLGGGLPRQRRRQGRSTAPS
jgi:NAD(P)-dependent dehydrogenase (short-subunit alcohol dehydrogenase family)